MKKKPPPEGSAKNKQIECGAGEIPRNREVSERSGGAEKWGGEVETEFTEQKVVVRKRGAEETDTIKPENNDSSVVLKES